MTKETFEKIKLGESYYRKFMSCEKQTPEEEAAYLELTSINIVDILIEEVERLQDLNKFLTQELERVRESVQAMLKEKRDAEF